MKEGCKMDERRMDEHWNKGKRRTEEGWKKFKGGKKKEKDNEKRIDEGCNKRN